MSNQHFHVHHLLVILFDDLYVAPAAVSENCLGVPGVPNGSVLYLLNRKFS